MLNYLASPYSRYPGGREEAFKLACQKAAELMESGLCVFCPIAHSHPIEAETTMEIKDGDWWLNQDFAILKHCTRLFVYCMPGWADSYGVRKEIEFARINKIPIEYLDYYEQTGTDRAAA